MYQNKTYLLNRKMPKVIYFIIFLALFIIIFTMIIINIPIHKLKLYTGFVVKNNDNYYIKIYVDDKNLKDINCQHVIVDDKKTKLKSFTIKEAYTIDNTLEVYHEVYLKLNISKEKRIENYKVEIIFVQESRTYLKMIIDYLKRGLYERVK